MTTRQIKTEIQKTLEEIPENILGDILEYLKQLKGRTKSNIDLSHHLSQIINEDKELLEKLAQ